MFHQLMKISMNSKMAHSSYKDDFKSIFSPYILRFLETKEAAGSNVRSFLTALREFDNFAMREHLPSVCIKQSDIEKWRSIITGKTPTTIYLKYCVVSQFLRYMARLGIPCYIPVYPRKPKNLYVPYIFSEDELGRMFKAADGLVFERRVFKCGIFSIPVLLRLLYSTGMRIGEACSLVNSDVDMVSRIILIRDTKNKRDRQLPISDSLFVILEQYREKRRKLPLRDVDNSVRPFLVALDGSPLTGQSARHWFFKILEQCGINYIPRVGPRIHDLRHTFAVHVLNKLAREGVDMHCCLPVLSIALGHKCVSDTEYYVRITREVYPHISDATATLSEYIFPTISALE